MHKQFIHARGRDSLSIGFFAMVLFRASGVDEKKFQWEELSLVGINLGKFGLFMGGFNIGAKGAWC